MPPVNPGPGTLESSKTGVRIMLQVLATTPKILSKAKLKQWRKQLYTLEFWLNQVKLVPRFSRCEIRQKKVALQLLNYFMKGDPEYRLEFTEYFHLHRNLPPETLDSIWRIFYPHKSFRTRLNFTSDDRDIEEFRLSQIDEPTSCTIVNDFFTRLQKKIQKNSGRKSKYWFCNLRTIFVNQDDHKDLTYHWVSLVHITNIRFIKDLEYIFIPYLNTVYTRKGLRHFVLFVINVKSGLVECYDPQQPETPENEEFRFSGEIESIVRTLNFVRGKKQFHAGGLRKGIEQIKFECGPLIMYHVYLMCSDEPLDTPYEDEWFRNMVANWIRK